MTKHNKYTVDIIDKNFNYSGYPDIYHFSNAKTAIVKLYDESNAVIETLQLCCPNTSELYSLIEKGADLNLNNCYLKIFSINEYRKSMKIPVDDLVIIKNFSAKNSFFDSEPVEKMENPEFKLCLDMADVRFTGAKLEIENTIFARGIINFERSVFENDKFMWNKCSHGPGKLNFAECKFNIPILDLSDNSFGNGDKNFTNTIFHNCSLKFSKCEFNNGILDFSFSKSDSGKIDFSKSNFGKGALNFSKAALGEGNKDFSYIDFGDSDLLFLNTKFNKGNVYFQGSKFHRSNIDFFRSKFDNGNIDFSYIQFGEGLKNFSNIKFGEGNVNFSYTDFGSGDLNFAKSVFGKGRKDFSNTIIGPGKVDFKNVDFGSGTVDFSNTVFGDGNVSFDKLKFDEGKIYFTSAQFGKGDVDFTNAQCMNGYLDFDRCLFTQNKISFYNSLLPVISFQKCQFNHYTDLRVLQCDQLDLRNTIFRDIIDLKPDGITPVSIRHLNLAEVKNSGLIYIDWKLNNVKQAVMIQENTSLRQKAEQFRMLKENFHNIGQYDYEDDAYVEYKSAEIKSDFFQSMKSKDVFIFRKIYDVILFLFKWLVLEQVGKFGTSPVRVLKSIFVAFLIFSIPYYVLQEVPNFDQPGKILNHHTTLQDAAYFSAYNMLIIGYEDYHPKGITGILSVLESFIGLFLMSYFTIAFVRKVLR